MKGRGRQPKAFGMWGLRSLSLAPLGQNTAENWMSKLNMKQPFHTTFQPINIVKTFRVFALSILLCWPAYAIAETANTMEPVDTALVVAVDTSRSVDDKRFRLQMEGIASALEDKAVQEAILGGPRGRILFSVVAWADRSNVILPWMEIGSAETAQIVAEKVRVLPRLGGEFTCLSRMLKNLNETLLVEMPTQAFRKVVDVSGDGIDNCDPPAKIKATRQTLIDKGVRINGLPIVVDRKQLHGGGAYRKPGYGLKAMSLLYDVSPMTLEDWYKKFVIGGFGSFIKPAFGYEDFGRAMRQKFVVEISQTYTRKYQ